MSGEQIAEGRKTLLPTCPRELEQLRRQKEHSLNATPRLWWRREQLRHSSDAKENNIYTRAVERGDEQALARAASGTASSRLKRGGDCSGYATKSRWGRRSNGFYPF